MTNRRLPPLPLDAPTRERLHRLATLRAHALHRAEVNAWIDLLAAAWRALWAPVPRRGLEG